MNCKIHIYLLNDLFSQELADAEFGGKESADNLRYEWEDELEIQGDVTSVQEIPDGIYSLAGYDENNEVFSYEIPKMHVIVSFQKQHHTLKLCYLFSLHRV